MIGLLRKLLCGCNAANNKAKLPESAQDQTLLLTGAENNSFIAFFKIEELCSANDARNE